MCLDNVLERVDHYMGTLEYVLVCETEIQDVLNIYARFIFHATSTCFSCEVKINTDSNGENTLFSIILQFLWEATLLFPN